MVHHVDLRVDREGRYREVTGPSANWEDSRPRGVVQNRWPSQIYRLERLAGGGTLAHKGNHKRVASRRVPTISQIDLAEGRRCRRLTRDIDNAISGFTPDSAVLEKERQPGGLHDKDHAIPDAIPVSRGRGARPRSAASLSEPLEKIRRAAACRQKSWSLFGELRAITAAAPAIATSYARLRHCHSGSMAGACFSTSLSRRWSCWRKATSRAHLVGSWAGAMGQPQFMPSSYLDHAVSYEGSRPADIWSSNTDVLASIANFIRKAGWISGLPWGVRSSSPTPSISRGCAIDSRIGRRKVFTQPPASAARGGQCNFVYASRAKGPALADHGQFPGHHAVQHIRGLCAFGSVYWRSKSLAKTGFGRLARRFQTAAHRGHRGGAAGADEAGCIKAMLMAGSGRRRGSGARLSN